MINKKIIQKITLPLLAAIMIVASIPAFGVDSTASTTANGSQITSKTKFTRSLEGSVRVRTNGRRVDCETSYNEISEAVYDGNKWEHNSMYGRVDMTKLIPRPSATSPNVYTCLGYGTDIVSRTGTSTYKSGKVYYTGVMESRTSHWEMGVCDCNGCVSDTTTTIESVTVTIGDQSKTSTIMVSTTVTSHYGDSYNVVAYQTTSTTTTNFTETAKYITGHYNNDLCGSRYGSYAIIELEGVSETVTKNSEGVVVSTMKMETFLCGCDYYELDCAWQPKVTVQYKGKTGGVSNSFKFELRKSTGSLIESRYNNGPSVYFHAQRYRNLDDNGSYIYKIKNTGTKKAGAKLDTHTLQYRVDVTHVGNGLLLIREARGGSKVFNIK